MANTQEVAHIENNFTYHAPFGTQVDRYQALRDKAKELAMLMVDLVPNSRERSLALTNLEQACFWANAGIARNEQEDSGPVEGEAWREDQANHFKSSFDPSPSASAAISAAAVAKPYNFMHRLSEEGLIEREGPAAEPLPHNFMDRSSETGAQENENN